jgi:hypothetical protein
MTVFGGQDLGRLIWELDEIMRVRPCDGLSGFRRGRNPNWLSAPGRHGCPHLVGVSTSPGINRGPGEGQHPLLGFPAFKFELNQLLFFINYPVSGIVLQQQKRGQDLLMAEHGGKDFLGLRTASRVP